MSRRATFAAGLFAVACSGGSFAMAGLAAVTVARGGGPAWAMAVLGILALVFVLVGIAATYGIGELIRKDELRTSASRRARRPTLVADPHYGAHWPADDE